MIGFALQDTLGNAFAGLAIQSEKPFNVGHWIRVGEFEGRVAEVTWRATKLRTKSGNFVIVPNNIVSKEAITNYSEPAAPTRIDVEVGASYLTAPNTVKAALEEALANSPQRAEGAGPRHHARPLRRLVDRLPRAVLDRGLRARRGGARPGAHGDLLRVRAPRHRHPVSDSGPVPMPVAGGPIRPPVQSERERLLAGVDLFATLTEEQRREIAAVDARPGSTATARRSCGRGSRASRCSSWDRAGRSWCWSRIDARSRRSNRGGYFGEMSLLTGEPRTATVLARGDTVVLEIDADLFRRLGAASPQAVEQIGVAAVTRRTRARSQSAARRRDTVVADAPASFVARMKKFLQF